MQKEGAPHAPNIEIFLHSKIEIGGPGDSEPKMHPFFKHIKSHISKIGALGAPDRTQKHMLCAPKFLLC